MSRVLVPVCETYSPRPQVCQEAQLALLEELLNLPKAQPVHPRSEDSVGFVLTYEPGLQDLNDLQVVNVWLLESCQVLPSWQLVQPRLRVVVGVEDWRCPLPQGLTDLQPLWAVWS
jgi:hypothetical protein